MNGYSLLFILLLEIYLGKWIKEIKELTMAMEKSWIATWINILL